MYRAATMTLKIFKLYIPWPEDKIFKLYIPWPEEKEKKY
jgi:hypothetical protein